MLKSLGFKKFIRKPYKKKNKITIVREESFEERERREREEREEREREFEALISSLI